MDAKSATVPLYIEHNRPFIDLTFTRPDGELRTARFWIDTGGGSFLMVESLAQELQVDLSESQIEADGMRITPITPPPTRLADMALDLEGVRAAAVMGVTHVPGMKAEGMAPGHLLQRYQVIFNYPERQFTLAQSGSQSPRGVQTPSPIHPQSGFPRVEINIAGESYGLLLDTGASYTMFSQTLIDQWSAQYPDWPYIQGAFGAANMIGGPMDIDATMLRLPQLEWADFTLEQVGVVSRPPGIFEEWMSAMATAPIVGALGGNVLQAFRIEIDYANSLLYLEQKNPLHTYDMDLVGLTLRQTSDGDCVVDNVSSRTGNAILQAVQAGDQLISVEGMEVTRLALSQIIDTLRGKPGQTRKLTLKRNDKRFSIEAPIIRLL